MCDTLTERDGAEASKKKFALKTISVTISQIPNPLKGQFPIFPNPNLQKCLLMKRLVSGTPRRPSLECAPPQCRTSGKIMVVRKHRGARRAGLGLVHIQLAKLDIRTLQHFPQRALRDPGSTVLLVRPAQLMSLNAGF